jgi:hypothetical protein
MNSKLLEADKWVEGEQQIREIVTLEEVLKKPILDTDEFHSFRVMKHGRTSAWSTGVVNEIKSDLQRGRGEVSTELCVLDHFSSKQFIQPGDSGCMVLDYLGRIVGFGHGGGFPKTSGVEFSYVTPVEWLLEDIKSTVDAASIEFC